MSEMQQVFDESIYKRLKENAPVALFSIVTELQKHGFIAWLAGGAVRDLILGRTPKDYDVVTNASPDEVQKIFKKTQSIGKQFGIIHVHWDDEIIEVASFRSDEAYVDGRRPTGVLLSHPKDDAWRRDFTVNALFYDLKQKEIIDYVNGLEDLENRQIKAVGDAGARFSEDHLRLLRALRFAATLDFEIDQDTLFALLKNKLKMVQVSQERIRAELEKAVPAYKSFADQLKNLGLLEILFPYFCKQQGSPADREVSIFKKPQSFVEMLFYFYERFSDLREIDSLAMVNIVEFYKLSRLEKETFLWALEFKNMLKEKKDNLQSRLFIFKTPEYSNHFQTWYSQWRELESIVGAIEVNMNKPLMTAKDCKELQGPRLGGFLNLLKERQLMGEINNLISAQALYKKYLSEKK